MWLPQRLVRPLKEPCLDTSEHDPETDAGLLLHLIKFAMTRTLVHRPRTVNFTKRSLPQLQNRSLATLMQPCVERWSHQWSEAPVRLILDEGLIALRHAHAAVHRRRRPYLCRKR